MVGVTQAGHVREDSLIQHHPAPSRRGARQTATEGERLSAVLEARRRTPAEHYLPTNTHR